MEKPKKAVILCGGLGTRMMPASKAVAKEMFPIVDKPVMQFLVENLIECGVKDILFVSNKQKLSVINYFNNGKANFYYIFPNKQKGVSDALMHAKTFVGNDNFILLFGDVLLFSKVSSVRQMLLQNLNTNSSVVLAIRVLNADIEKFGSIKFCTKNNIKWLSGIVEKPKKENAPSNLAIAGQYVLSKNIFKFLSHKKLFTDCLVEYSKQNPISIKIAEGKFFDIGSKSGYVSACNFYHKNFLKN